MLRERLPELMDDPALDAGRHREALRALARLNQISRAAGGIWNAVKPHIEAGGGRRLSLMDVATGAGDVPLALAELAAADGYIVDIHAADISKRALEVAREQAEAKGLDASFDRMDAVAKRPPQEYDVVTASLFTHHLDPPEVVKLLSHMKSCARRLVVVSDLERNWLNYWLVFVATRLFTASPVARYDGPVSVRAAYTLSELGELAQLAGMSGYSLRRDFPCRMILVWKAP